jgi:hypothetical protein
VKTINFYRAEPINDHGGEPTPIAEQIPAMGVENFSVKDAQALYATQGRVLADALYDSLPGGTLDELLAELLQRRASLFRVGCHRPAGVEA